MRAGSSSASSPGAIGHQHAVAGKIPTSSPGKHNNPGNPPPGSQNTPTGPTVIACELLQAVYVSQAFPDVTVMQSPNNGPRCDYQLQSGQEVSTLTLQVLEQASDGTDINGGYIGTQETTKRDNTENGVNVTYTDTHFRTAEEGFQYRDRMPDGFSDEWFVMRKHHISYMMEVSAAFTLTYSQLRLMLYAIRHHLP